MDTPRAAAAIAQYAPHIALQGLDFLGQGSDSAAFESSGTIFLFPISPGSRRTLPKLCAILPQLAPYLSVEIPQPRPFFNASAELVFVSYKKVPGHTLGRGKFTRAPASLQCQTVGSMIDFTCQLQSFPVAQASAHGILPRHYHKSYSRDLEHFQSMQASARYLPDIAAQGVISTFQSYLNNPANFAFTPVLVHGDLNGNNIFFDSESRLSGVIDFGDLHIGDPMFDLARPYKRWGAPFLAAAESFFPPADHEMLRTKLNFFALAQLTQRLRRAHENKKIPLQADATAELIDFLQSSGIVTSRVAPVI